MRVETPLCYFIILCWFSLFFFVVVVFLFFLYFFTFIRIDDDDDNAELSDEEAADGDANEAKQRQRRQQVQRNNPCSFPLLLPCEPARNDLHRKRGCSPAWENIVHETCRRICCDSTTKLENGLDCTPLWKGSMVLRLWGWFRSNYNCRNAKKRAFIVVALLLEALPFVIDFFSCSHLNSTQATRPLTKMRKMNLRHSSMKVGVKAFCSNCQ